MLKISSFAQFGRCLTISSIISDPVEALKDTFGNNKNMLMFKNEPKSENHTNFGSIETVRLIINIYSLSFILFYFTKHTFLRKNKGFKGYKEI